jgi:hypothetical protein
LEADPILKYQVDYSKLPQGCTIYDLEHVKFYGSAKDFPVKIARVTTKKSMKEEDQYVSLAANNQEALKAFIAQFEHTSPGRIDFLVKGQLPRFYNTNTERLEIKPVWVDLSISGTNESCKIAPNWRMKNYWPGKSGIQSSAKKHFQALCKACNIPCEKPENPIHNIYDVPLRRRKPDAKTLCDDPDQYDYFLAPIEKIFPWPFRSYSMPLGRKNPTKAPYESTTSPQQEDDDFVEQREPKRQAVASNDQLLGFLDEEIRHVEETRQDTQRSAFEEYDEE